MSSERSHGHLLVNYRVLSNAPCLQCPDDHVFKKCSHPGTKFIYAIHGNYYSVRARVYTESPPLCEKKKKKPTAWWKKLSERESVAIETSTSRVHIIGGWLLVSLVDRHHNLVHPHCNGRLNIQIFITSLSCCCSETTRPPARKRFGNLHADRYMRWQLSNNSPLLRTIPGVLQEPCTDNTLHTTVCVYPSWI